MDLCPSRAIDDLCKNYKDDDDAEEESILNAMGGFPSVPVGAAARTEAEQRIASALNKLVGVAAYHKHSRVITKLLELGASPDGNWSPGACEPEDPMAKVYPDLPPLGSLIKPSGMNVETCHPVMTATVSGSEECLRVLFAAGADPNACGMNPRSPLIMIPQIGMQFCSVGHPPSKVVGEGGIRIAGMLIDAGADVNAITKVDGTSALHFAGQYALDALIELLVSRGADLELPSKKSPLGDGEGTPLVYACYAAAQMKPPDFSAAAIAASRATVKLLMRLGAKLAPPTMVALERDGNRCLPESMFRDSSSADLVSLANCMRYVIDNGGDDAEPNSRATPEALAKRVALVDEFERLAAAFAVGDKVVVDGLRAKPKYNGKAAVVRGRLNARGRFLVTVAMRDGPETIALKLANLRAADE